MDDISAKRLHDQPRAEAPPWGLLLLLMAVTAIGPTTLNVVVPALPEMANRLASDVATVQLTVSVYLLALAAGQLVTGPLSDRFGRRPVLLAGLTLTAAASVLAISVGTVGSLIAARVLQALGASAGIVVSRAIIRDLFDRNRAAAMIGLVATVMVVVPTLGPLIGGVLDTAFGWESIFLFTAITSAMVVVWTALALPETRGLNAPPGAREGFLARFQAALGQRQVRRLCAGRHVRLRHVLCLPRRRAARDHHADGALVGGIRRVVCDLLDRLHGRQLRRLAALDGLWHRPADLVGHCLRGARASPWRSPWRRCCIGDR